MKPISEVETILLDSGLKASGLDFAALESVRGLIGAGSRRSMAALPMENRMALAGFTLAQLDRIELDPAMGSDLKQGFANQAKVVRDEFDRIPALDSPEWIYFELGQWGATGDRTYLSRIMDRARHRDGSGVTIQASTAAIGVLQLAAFSNAAYLGIFSEMGFDPDAVKYANVSIGNFSLDKLRGDRDIQPDAVVLDPDYEAAQTAAASAPASVPSPLAMAQPITTRAASATGQVSLLIPTIAANLSSGQIDSAAGPVSISDGLRFILQLTAATRQLLLPLPYEGYQWDDYAGNDTVPASILFTADAVDAERLKLFQPVALQPLFVAGRVIHDGLGWVPSQFDAAGRMFMPLSDVRLDDINDAKFVVTTWFRKRLAESGSTPAGSSPAPSADEAAATKVGAQTILQAPAGPALTGDTAPVLEATASTAVPLHPAAKKPAVKKKAAAKSPAKKKAKKG